MIQLYPTKKHYQMEVEFSFLLIIIIMIQNLFME